MEIELKIIENNPSYWYSSTTNNADIIMNVKSVNGNTNENEFIDFLGEELSNIINTDGDDMTDGEVIDEIVEFLKEYNLYTKR